MKQESPTILEEEPELSPNSNVNEEDNDKSGQQKGSEALKSEPIPITISMCKDRKSRFYFRISIIKLMNDYFYSILLFVRFDWK